MTKYLISWTEETWYNLEIEAADKMEALDKFHNNEYDSEDAVFIGSELQDSVEIEEI